VAGSDGSHKMFEFRKARDVWASPRTVADNHEVQHHEARAEFRRGTRQHPWILAGVWVDHVVFQPASPGVEPITQRLPDTGLLGWIDLPTVIAPTVAAAGEAGLAVARQAWPDRVRTEVPFASAS
jgi:hypothetical protein